MRCSNLVLVPLGLLSLGLAASCAVQEHPFGNSPTGGAPTGQPTATGSGGDAVAPGGAGGNGGAAGAGTGGATGPGGSTGVGGMTGTGSGGAAGSAPAADGGVVGPGGAGGSAMPPSGMVINGVAKEKMIAFIHFGHSNMAGRGTEPISERPFFFETMPRAWMFHTDKKWELVKEPFSAGDTSSLSSTRGGPGTAIIKTAVKAAAADYHFVSLGYGKNSAYCSQYAPGAIFHDPMMAAVKELKGKVTFGGIFVMLGITERHGTAADRSGYASCLNKLVTFIRTEVGDPNVPLLLTDYEVTATGEFVVGGAVERAIRPQIMMVPTVVSRSAIVPTDALTLEDDHHFQLDSHRIWAERAIKIMQDKGWFPWGAAQ